MGSPYVGNYRIREKVEQNSIPERKGGRRRHALRYEIITSLETSKKKSLIGLAQQTRPFASSVRNAIQLLREKPYNMTVAQKLNSTDK